MRAFAAWAWIAFFIAGLIYYYLYFADGRTNAFQFAIGTAFLVLAGVNFLRSRKRGNPPPPDHV
ncbi:MAG TPA: hypothetical protein VNO75_09210 [Gemmatimonadaceae bacterium]|nr:hypothetical protein [Gemmatimonadaceae bacterium]